jgi:hypothetical protein
VEGAALRLTARALIVNADDFGLSLGGREGGTVTDPLQHAGELRLAGRWGEALDVLEPLGDDIDALRERILVLADESLLARDRSGELDEVLDRLDTVGKGERRVEAFVLERRGLLLAEQGRREEAVELARRRRSGFERVGADRFLGLLATEFDELGT